MTSPSTWEDTPASASQSSGGSPASPGCGSACHPCCASSRTSRKASASRSTAICAYMIANIVMTVLSFNYWYERQNGNPIETPLQSYFAENYSDEFMSERFQTMSLCRPCETWESMIASTYHLGIDIDDATAKAVVFDPSRSACSSRATCVTTRIRWKRSPPSCARWQRNSPERSFRLVACGSGGTTIADVLGVPFVQEVVANSLAVRRDHERCAARSSSAARTRRWCSSSATRNRVPPPWPTCA